MPRRKIAAALAAAAVASGLSFAAPASAYCDPVYELLGMGCTNECKIAAQVYYRATGRYAPWECPA